MKRIAALLILSSVSLSACASTKWVRTPVAKEHAYLVALEQSRIKGTVVPQAYRHPHQIDRADLEKLMAELTYVEKTGLLNKTERRPVFQAPEIEKLAPGIVEALARADASQRVRFTSFNQGEALVFSVSRKTEGVMFIDSGGRLHIAFNFINAKRQPSETSALFYSYSAIDPLKIKTSATPLSSVPAYAEIHAFADGARAPMWIEVNREKLREATRTAPVPTVKPAEDLSPAAPAPPKAKSLDTTVEKPAAAHPGADVMEEDIKDKLRFLKELQEEGLISEKDYNAKKRELLDRID